MNSRMALLPLLTLVIGACASGTAPAAGTGALAWIDRPLDDARFPFGPAIPIRWHASAIGGIQQVEIHINAKVFAVARDFDHSAPIITQQSDWTPTASGEYTIQAVATSRMGDTANSVEHHITIGDVSPPLAQSNSTPTVSSTATPTRLTPSIAATPSPTPSHTRTLQPQIITLTPTRTLPPQQPPVVNPTFTPTRTRTPLPPADTKGPSAPGIIAPKNNVLLPCSHTVKLDWSAPSDPSGIANYRVRLQRSVGGQWNDVRTWDPVIATTVTWSFTDSSCGRSYRWNVFARDKAGNTGSVSSWSEFRIEIPFG
jgi:hypothetical protein